MLVRVARHWRRWCATMATSEFQPVPEDWAVLRRPFGLGRPVLGRLWGAVSAWADAEEKAHARQAEASWRDFAKSSCQGHASAGHKLTREDTGWLPDPTDWVDAPIGDLGIDEDGGELIADPAEEYLRGTPGAAIPLGPGPRAAAITKEWGELWWGDTTDAAGAAPEWPPPRLPRLGAPA